MRVDCVVEMSDSLISQASGGAELFGAAQKRPGRRGGTVGRFVLGVFGAGDQDAFDGAIGRVADLDRAGARGLQPRTPVFVAQPEHPLGRPQVMDGVIGHEFRDHRLTGRADQLGGAPTPGRGLHRERDLLWRVVIKVGGPPAGSAHMGGHHIGTGEDLHDVPGCAGMQALSDQPPRHAVERLGDLEMRIDSDGANRPRGQLEGPGRQRVQRITFDRLEHSQWLGALQGTAVPGAGHLAAPAQRVGLHLAQRGELATLPE